MSSTQSKALLPIQNKDVVKLFFRKIPYSSVNLSYIGEFLERYKKAGLTFEEVVNSIVNAKLKHYNGKRATNIEIYAGQFEVIEEDFNVYLSAGKTEEKLFNQLVFYYVLEKDTPEMFETYLREQAINERYLYVIHLITESYLDNNKIPKNYKEILKKRFKQGETISLSYDIATNLVNDSNDFAIVYFILKKLHSYASADNGLKALIPFGTTTILTKPDILECDQKTYWFAYWNAACYVYKDNDNRSYAVSACKKHIAKLCTINQPDLHCFINKYRLPRGITYETLNETGFENFTHHSMNEFEKDTICEVFKSDVFINHFRTDKEFRSKYFTKNIHHMLGSRHYPYDVHEWPEYIERACMKMLKQYVYSYNYAKKPFFRYNEKKTTLVWNYTNGIISVEKFICIMQKIDLTEKYSSKPEVYDLKSIICKKGNKKDIAYFFIRCFYHNSYTNKSDFISFMTDFSRFCKENPELIPQKVQNKFIAYCHTKNFNMFSSDKYCEFLLRNRDWDLLNEYLGFTKADYVPLIHFALENKIINDPDFIILLQKEIYSNKEIEAIYTDKQFKYLFEALTASYNGTWLSKVKQYVSSHTDLKTRIEQASSNIDNDKKVRTIARLFESGIYTANEVSDKIKLIYMEIGKEKIDAIVGGNAE